MKVAVVYDRVNKWGGAERVLLALHAMYPNAPLFTSVYDKKKAPWAKVFRVKTSFLQNIPFIRSHHELFPFLMPLAFALFSFKKYDLVISVTSEYAKGIIVSGKTKHLCICLTPTRYLWSGYDEYFTDKIFRFITFPFVWALRMWDREIAQLPDMYIAISTEVQKRIKKYYDKPSRIVFPPIPKLPIVKKSSLFEKDYFLVVSRLSRFTSYKRVDIAVKAANLLHASLVVIGDGNKEVFGKMAGPTVHFVGKVSDELLAQYYTNCQALIFPAYEDFGLVMTEALSFGKPVIAYKRGGALDIVKQGKTGTFFATQTASSLVKTLKSFQRTRYNSLVCKKEAERFSEKAFQKGIKHAVSDLIHKK